MFKVVYRTMNEEKAEDYAANIGGKVVIDNTGYVCESGFVSNSYMVVVEKEEKEEKES